MALEDYPKQGDYIQLFDPNDGSEFRCPTSANETYYMGKGFHQNPERAKRDRARVAAEKAKLEKSVEKSKEPTTPPTKHKPSSSKKRR